LIQEGKHVANRIIRGFSRLGVGVAVLVALCGLAIVTVDQNSRLSHPREARNGAIEEPLVLELLNAPEDTWLEYTRIRVKDAVPALGLTAALALVAFGLCRGLGWIIVGFARD
jgi:hypothetical protein